MNQSLYSLEINVEGYNKKLFLISNFQLRKEVGEIVVNYLSKLEPYNSRERFIESLHAQLSEPIEIDGVTLPDYEIPYKERERVLINYLHRVICDSMENNSLIEIDSFTTVSIDPIEDLTAIKL